MLRVLAIVFLVFGASETLNDSTDGYPSETHHVTTDDGYILGLKRIPYGMNPGSSHKRVVLLMHDVLLGSNSFTYLGPKYGIAYNLADSGYDVWIGNARGNKYSRCHVNLDPDEDKRQFFNFSYEEIGLLDLPAIINYVLAQTGQDKLHYIGHSQGGTIFFVLNSMNTMYQSKFASVHLLAGLGFTNNFPNTAINQLAYETDALYAAAVLTGTVEIPPEYNTLLGNNIVTQKFELIDSVFGNLPRELFAGASIKQVAHYFQNNRDKSFCRFDYGCDNFERYGMTSPPAYDLTRININVTLHYSVNDDIQSEADVLAMAEALPNAKARKVPRDTFRHVDFILKKDVKNLVTNHIIDCFNNS